MKHINADELIEFCTSMLVEAKDDLIIQTHNNCFRHMREHIKSSPSADVRENIHGEWIDKHGVHRCSCCNGNALVVCDQDKETFEYLSDFCPHCGADMRGKSE